MYTNYKQQYAFGFGPCDLTGKTLSTSDFLYYGTEVGDKASLALAKMIDLKDKKQMAYEKALLQFRCLEAPEMGANQKLTITVTGTATADGTIKFEEFGEDLDETLSIDYSEISSASDIANAMATFLGSKLETWNVSVESGVITLVRKEQKANITVNTTNFKMTVGTLTGITVGNATSVTSGSANDAVIAFDIVTCGRAVDGTADTSNAKKLATVYLDCAAYVDSYEPFEEITFPKAADEFVGLVASADKSATFTSGKFLVHFNPFI